MNGARTARFSSPAVRRRPFAVRAVFSACAALACSGCSEVEHALSIATPWTAAERAGLDDAIRRTGAGPVRWVLLAPGDDLSAVARRRNPPDLIVGGAASDYQAKTRRGVVARGGGDEPAWRLVRRSPTGNAADRAADSDAQILGFNDPRRDPRTLAWAKAELTPVAWADGYARLVGAAGGGTTAAASVDGWEGAEGAAVVTGCRHPEAARALLRVLAVPSENNVPEANPTADALLADLLGATLIDARDELRAAGRALEGAGRPPRAAAWMAQPPPWPPASVARILGRDRNAMPLLETLAREIAPEADVRAWLVRSWLAPGRSVDGRLLAELAAAERGRLAREPRFRAWLRAEWTAWARQRYRRVARLSASDPGVPAS